MSPIHLKIIKFLIVPVMLLCSSIQISVAQNTSKPQPSCESDSIAGWSPDNKKILFVSERSGNSDIWIMDTNGNNPINLTPNNDFSDYSPVWSPDSKQIAFLSNREKNSNLWLMNADGSSVESLDADQSHGYGSPVWAKDGHHIAIPFVNGTKIDIGIIDTKTKTLTNLTEASNVSFKGVSWSPDNSKLVATTASDEDVYIMDADGSHLSIIESEPFNIQVAYSPVDDFVLLTKTPQIGADNSDIWQINLNDNKRFNLTESNTGADISPAWSPDGQSIIFLSDRNRGSRGIWKMTATGSNQINLTKDFDDTIFYLVWSPDGTQIAFSTLKTEKDKTWKASIWVMNADGSASQNVSKISCST